MINKELTWNDARKTKPPIDAEVVCEVKGVPHAKHFICKWDGAYWWYWDYFNEIIIGWIGLKEDWEVVKWKEI